MKKFSSTLLVLIVSVLFAKILCEEGKNFHITSCIILKPALECNFRVGHVSLFNMYDTFAFEFNCLI